MKKSPENHPRHCATETKIGDQSQKEIERKALPL